MGAMDATDRTEVFIVDDAPLIRDRLREFVTVIPGVEVVGDAGTAEEAIAGILATHPACVLLDYQLDGGTGVDVLRAVAPQLPGTTFVVLTNHFDPQFRRACMAAGADLFLDKSTEFTRVGDVLRELVDSPRQPSHCPSTTGRLS
jgi:DNA-binding NarL/FixJ family response regulator